MLIITNSMAWSFFYFFIFIYLFFIFSLILYILPLSKGAIAYATKKKNSTFEYYNGFDYFLLMTLMMFLFLQIFSSYTHYTITAWFGHLIVSGFQIKMSFFVTWLFYFLLYIYLTFLYFSSREVYDFILTLLHFFVWSLLLFYSNNLFTFLFFIEILGTLIFLLIISSSFSTTFYYNNLNFNLSSYFNNLVPFFFIQTLLYYFWISLIASLNLFVFTSLFFLKFFTFDWFIFEFIFLYLINNITTTTYVNLLLIWFNILFTIFLKCGLVPFFFWKPVFFRSIPLHGLFFYICFFYYLFFLYLLYFMYIYMSEIFLFFSFVSLLLLICGIFILLTLLCEAFYIKIFLALSSILNSIFVFLALITLVTEDVLFLL